MIGRYTHAHQFKRAGENSNCAPVIRDIRRKIEGDTRLEDRFGPLLDLVHRVRHQEQRQRGPKVSRCTHPRWSASAKARLARLTSSRASSMVTPTAISISCCRGPTESKTSEPWPENSAYRCWRSSI
jgi:hypothetical protein